MNGLLCIGVAPGIFVGARLGGLGDRVVTRDLCPVCHGEGESSPGAECDLCFGTGLIPPDAGDEL